MEKNLDRRPWPETSIFIEMGSACMNQQGNGDEVENSARPFFVIFLALWLNLCNNIEIKHGFPCINVCQVPREMLKTEAVGRGFQLLPRDRANVNVLENHV